MSKKVNVLSYSPALLGLMMQDVSAANGCPAGSYFPAEDRGGEACILAPRGSFVPEANATEATLAPAGSFVDTTGATRSSLAPAGSYVPNEGAVAPIEASVGFFVPIDGAAEQTPAPRGFFVSEPGQTSATAAQPGTFVAEPGQTSATKAPPGRFVAEAGQTSALAAPAGTFVNVFGATEASDCPENSNNYAMASIACRALSPDALGQNGVVGPAFATSLQDSGNPVGPILLGDSLAFSFSVENASTDIGFDPMLTDLSILALLLPTGVAADPAFAAPLTLGVGEQSSIDLLFDSSAFGLGAFTAVIEIGTDQFADPLQTGQTFSYRFSGEVLSEIPLPGTGTLLFAGAGLLYWRRRSPA